MPRQYQDILKLEETISALGSAMRTSVFPVSKVLYAEGSPDFNDSARLRDFTVDETWGGYDMDAWFRVDFTVPSEMDGKDIWLELHTGREGKWNAINPQFLVFVNGIETQGMDTAHTTILLKKNARSNEKLTVDFDAWSGAVAKDSDNNNAWDDANGKISFRAFFYSLNEKIKDLYFDMKVPCETAVLLDDSVEAIRIKNGLRQAADILDLREIGSPAFFESVDICSDYMEKEFYGNQRNIDILESYLIKLFIASGQSDEMARKSASTTDRKSTRLNSSH